MFIRSGIIDKLVESELCPCPQRKDGHIQMTDVARRQYRVVTVKSSNKCIRRAACSDVCTGVRVCVRVCVGEGDRRE